MRIGVHYTSFDAFFAQLDDFYVGNGEEEGSTIDVSFIDHYEVYLDGQLRGTVSEPVYTFTHLVNGRHVAGVKAIYTSGASAMVEYVFTIQATALPGDVNGDGRVDVDDLNIIINIILELNQDADARARADVDGSGQVDIDDINSLINILLTQ